MEYILALIVSLFSYIIYSDHRRKIAETLAENFHLKNKLNEGNKDIAKNEGLDEAEEEKRSEILKDLEHNKYEDSLEKLKDVFNKPDNN